MTPKERAAMQQALEALEKTGIEGTWLLHDEAITALREALDHSGEANETVINWEAIDKEQLRRYKEKFGDFEQTEQEPGVKYPGCDYCNDELFCGRKCKCCGKVFIEDEDFVQSEVKSLRQQVAALKAVLDAWNNVEQEPVAWVDLEQWQSGEYDCFTSEKVADYMTPLYAAPVQQAEQKPIGYVIEDNDYEGSKIRAEPINGCCLPVYLAPVRTKDLTDDEIEAIMVEQGDLRTTAFARAVIQADREKNKCQH